MLTALAYGPETPVMTTATATTVITATAITATAGETERTEAVRALAQARAAIAEVRTNGNPEA